MKKLTIIDLSERDWRLPWPLLVSQLASLTVKSRYSRAGLISGSARMIDFLDVDRVGSLLLPVSYEGGTCQWQTDLSLAHCQSLLPVLESIYPGIKASSGGYWLLDGMFTDTDCIAMPGTVDGVEYAKRLVSAELSLYESMVNHERYKQGLKKISSVREVYKRSCKQQSVRHIYTNESDVRYVFKSSQPLAAWLEKPTFNSHLVLSSAHETLQREKMIDVFMDLLESHSLGYIKLVSATGVHYYASSLGQHFLLKAKCGVYDCFLKQPM